MPMLIGAWLAVLDQVREGRSIDARIRTLRKWAVTDPLSLVPRSRRARAQVDLRHGEYLALLGQADVSRETLREQEARMADAQAQAEQEARMAIERDREALRGEPATRLDVAQLAMDMVTLGRVWSEQFNRWSSEQEQALAARLRESDMEIERLRGEIAELRDRLQSA